MPDLVNALWGVTAALAGNTVALLAFLWRLDRRVYRLELKLFPGEK